MTNVSFDYRILDTNTNRQYRIGFRSPEGVLWYSMVPDDYVLIRTTEYNALLDDRNAARQAQTVDPAERRDKMFKRFHALGREKFGDEWDDARPNVVRLVSHGEHDSSTVMDENELRAAIKMLEATG